MKINKLGIAIHGGAGTILPEKMTPGSEKEIRATLNHSIQTGYDILSQNGSALDAVQAAVNVMEDSPLFNAGKGAVFTHDGINEQDATIMDGANLNSGAVASVRHVKNPIDLARCVMEQSEHALLGGEGAEIFGKENNVKLVDPKYFFTERRWQQLQTAIKREEAMLDHSDDKCGTVGAVALDADGNLAAATSSGGMTNKKNGRIGDSALQGAGTYADNNSCAVSTTGHGEFFIRAVTAYDLSAIMKYKSLNLNDASAEAMKQLSTIGGKGGFIAIDKDGNIVMPFNTPGMYRGYLLNDMDKTLVEIFK